MELLIFIDELRTKYQLAYHFEICRAEATKKAYSIFVGEGEGRSCKVYRSGFLGGLPIDKQ